MSDGWKFVVTMCAAVSVAAMLSIKWQRRDIEDLKSRCHALERRVTQVEDNAEGVRGYIYNLQQQLKDK